MNYVSCVLGFLFLFTSSFLNAQTSKPEVVQEAEKESTLPKVVLIGDSIRLSYAAIVIEKLKGKASVISPKANCGDSSKVLANLQKWVIDEHPDLIHFNCGIHDTKKFKTGKFQVSPEQYEKNLKQIIETLRKETNAVIMFATSTPILDERAAKVRATRDYALLNESIRTYNKIAMNLMVAEEIPVDDLYFTMTASSEPFRLESLIAEDGVHLQGPARKLLGEQVAKAIQHQLSLKKQ